MACGEKGFEVLVNSQKFSFREREVKVSDLLKEVGEELNVIQQVFSGGSREILNISDYVDLGRPGLEKFIAFREEDAFFFKLNGELRVVDDKNSRARDIIAQSGLSPIDDYSLVEQESEKGNVLIGDKEKITLEKGCVREFFIFPNDQVYTFKVDKKKYVSRKSSLTGRDILVSSGLEPVCEYELIQKFCGNKRERIELDDVVDLTVPGIEKFVSIPLDQREG